MPQCKAMHSSQKINQSLFLVLKMETSQHNPYESESLCSMDVNEVAMPQYKPSKVTMLQDKSKSITNERAMSQNKSSSQKLTINEWSVSQCRISSRVTASPIKVLSGYASV